MSRYSDKLAQALKSAWGAAVVNAFNDNRGRPGRTRAHVAMNSPLTQTELIRRCFSAAQEYADAYDSSAQSPFFNERLRLVLNFLAPIESGKLLDVGCGPGILLNRLIDGPLEISGIDLCPEMIAEAGARTAGRANLRIGQLEHLPYEDKTFDVIVGLGVLEYLSDQRAALSEMARVAKPGATVILSMVNRVSLYRRWERLVFNPWCTLRSGGRVRSEYPEPRMWLQGAKSLVRMMADCHLQPIDVVYYDFNVCVAPFDLKFPKQASVLNDRARRYCARRLFPFVHTAFLVKACMSP
jgi:ubiquinone/menaquinone biosynthesis C-methylase UbiE